MKKDSGETRTLSKAQGKAQAAPRMPGPQLVTDAPVKPKWRRLDWERIRRDHSTGKYTLAELAAMHDTAEETISRRRKRDRTADPGAWPVDRSEEVRRATAALLIQASTKATISEGQAAEAVLAAAHATKDVILSHRTDAKAARSLANALVAELADVTHNKAGVARLLELAAADLDEAERAAMHAQARELLKLHSRAATLQKLTDAMQRAQVMERRAFGISDDDKGESPLDTMNERELQAEIDRLGQQLGTGPYLAAVDGRSVAAGS